ncbi:hypothetical protein IMCC21906_02065 [Spongiibacter sp. IMCC21906]|jgi:hypothetical protein|uniref:DUF6586 family protein n=1 Tax=Spongiibacter sp. IMCC21906 TaxID=1620392 RepID=UPI00062E081F|nr:DUF6586 family protein [Spongiibacter sp. IMCC21906]AKH69735.1 hypothetical protein IMCC21906_02065 [Spongiibacter sp. IMCC21906]
MRESYRGQCNLHLHFAKQFLTSLDQEPEARWGGHYARAMADAVVWQLQLSYRAHLADMLTQQPKFPQQLPKGDYFACDFKASELPPELLELADRERHTPWLRAMVSERFINHPGAAVTVEVSGLIAKDSLATHSQGAGELEEWLEELNSLIARHRATLMEY